MNFKDLMEKIKAIDEGQAIAPTKDDEGNSLPQASDESLDECGMEVSHSEQPDSVTMSVSMNGSGANGIKDLMNILKNIEQGGELSKDSDDKLFGEPSDEEPIMGDIVDAMQQDMEGVEPPVHYGGQGPEGAKFDLYMQQRKDQLASQKPVGEEYGNAAPDSSGPQTQGIKAVTPTGDDLSSKGKGALKRNGGENPMQEALVQRLSAMYEEVKASEAYNPNSASAQHRRDLDKHDHDRLKAAAEKDGATDADKARYKRYQDKKAAVKAAYDAEMDR